MFPIAVKQLFANDRMMVNPSFQITDQAVFCNYSCLTQCRFPAIDY